VYLWRITSTNGNLTTLSDQFVAVDGVRVDIQGSADVGMPQNGLYRLNVGLGLGD